MEAPAPTPEQKKLFELMANYTINTVCGWVSEIYKKFGPKIAAGDAFTGLILPFAQTYFNKCAVWIYSREDPWINEKFDEMCAIKLEKAYDPIDILHMIVMMCLNTVNEMDIRDVMSENYIGSMEATQIHLHAVVRRQESLARSLRGCPDDHQHEPIRPGDTVFTFAIDKYAQTKNGPVKLTTLEL
jgi:hypothetical protein